MTEGGKDPDAILAGLLATYPAAVDGRWTQISSDFASLFGEAKPMNWLKNRAKKLEKSAATTSQPEERPGTDEVGQGGDMEFPSEVQGCVRVFTGTRGRGLQCTRDVKKGDVMIGIPKKWALSAMADSSGGNSGQINLALQLLDLRDRNDMRVRHLPITSDHPCFWSAEELSWLKASFCYESACNQRRTLQGLYPGKKQIDCTEDDFLWAMCMVQSRQFGEEGCMIFLPFVDLINSEVAPDLWLDIRQENGYINIHATRDFQKGEEALVSYHGSEPPGLFSNFLGYGFVPDVVSYPPPRLSDHEGAAQQQLEEWTRHLEGLPEEDPAAKDMSGHSWRKVMANQILRHERRMTLEHIAHMKEQMAK